jgi:hypothetical protein
VGLAARRQFKLSWVEQQREGRVLSALGNKEEATTWPYQAAKEKSELLIFH